MKFKGKDILEDKDLCDFLLNSDYKLLKIKWHDDSITNGYGKEIYIGKLNDKLSLIEGLWSEPITNNIELTFEFPNLDLYKVFTLSEAALIWNKDESTIREALVKKFIPYVEYRKAGRITFITRKAMERVYGELEED